jgi:uncharacterized protein YndB with AHSA1/START domain
VTHAPTTPLRYVMDLHASRDAVWALWTDPRQVAGWLCESVALEPAVGGRFLASWDQLPVAGELLFVDRPRLLLFEWNLEGSASQVEVRMLPTLRGTRLEVSHRGLARELCEEADRRWQSSLERLLPRAARER